MSVRPATALRRCIALSLLVASAPAGVRANGVTNCHLSQAPDHYMRLGTCAGENAAGRIDFVVSPESGTVGAWTIRITSLRGKTLATTRCEATGRSTTCATTTAKGWARSYDSTLTNGNQHVTADSMVDVRYVFSVGPLRKGTPFSGGATFTSAGTPRA